MYELLGDENWICCARDNATELPVPMVAHWPFCQPRDLAAHKQVGLIAISASKIINYRA